MDSREGSFGRGIGVEEVTRREEGEGARGEGEENERAAVVFVRCGGGLARGDASGVFLW